MAGDQGITTVKIFDVSERGDAEWANLRTGGAAAIGFTPDGARLVTRGDDGSLTVWDAETGHRSATLGTARPSSATPVALSVGARGDVASAIQGEVTVRSLERTGAEVDVSATAWVEDVAWNPDGSLLALARSDGRLEIVNKAGRAMTELAGAPGFRLRSAEFSPDGSLVAASRVSADRPGTGREQVTVWDWREQKVVREIRASGKLAFSADGSLLAIAPVFGPASVWDLGSGEEVARLVGHTGGVTDVEFAPNGSVVATGSADGTVRLWDAETGVERLLLRGHRGAVVDVAFGPDGTKLASASTDGVVRVWALDLDQLVLLAEQSVTRGLTSEECSRYPSACG